MGPHICKGVGGSFGAVSWNAENLRFSAPPLADLDNLRCQPLTASGSRNIAPIQFLSGPPGRHVGKLAENLTKPLSAFGSLALVLYPFRIKAAQPHATVLAVARACTH